MNIYKRKDGRYEGRISSASITEGKRYISFYGKTVGETKKKMQEYVDMIFSRAPEIHLTVKNLFEEWIAAIGVRVKESTIINYRRRVETHILPMFGELNTCDIRAEQVQQFVSDKLSDGLTPNYVVDIAGTLKSMFKFAARKYGIVNPMVDVILPKKSKPQVEILTKRQQADLRDYLERNTKPAVLGIALPLFTGLRIGELCALKWSDIDLNEKTLTVSRILQRIGNNDKKGTRLVMTAPKSASSQRVIPLPDCITPMLKKFQANEEHYVLSGTTKPIEPRTMQYRFQAVLKKEKLPSIHFHALRHMFATNCVELGFDIKSLSEILGHSSVEITLNSYVHSSMERKKSFMDRLSLTT